MNIDGVIPGSAIPYRPKVLTVVSAAMFSYIAEPTTDNRSQGRYFPKVGIRVESIMMIGMEGIIENKALLMITLFLTSREIPRLSPSFSDLERKTRAWMTTTIIGMLQRTSIKLELAIA